MRTTQNITTVWESFFEKFSRILKFFIYFFEINEFQEKKYIKPTEVCVGVL